MLFWTGIRIGRMEEEKSAGEAWRIVKREEQREVKWRAVASRMTRNRETIQQV